MGQYLRYPQTTSKFLCGIVYRGQVLPSNLLRGVTVMRGFSVLISLLWAPPGQIFGGPKVSSVCEEMSSRFHRGLFSLWINVEESSFELSSVISIFKVDRTTLEFSTSIVYYIISFNSLMIMLYPVRSRQILAIYVVKRYCTLFYCLF